MPGYWKKVSNYVALLQKKLKISINTGNCAEKKYFIKKIKNLHFRKFQ